MSDTIKCAYKSCTNICNQLYIDGFKSTNDRDGRVWNDGVVCDWCHLYYCQDCENNDIIMLFDGYSDKLICIFCWDLEISQGKIVECDVCNNNNTTIKCEQCLLNFCLGCLNYDFDELKTCDKHINYLLKSSAKSV